MGQFLQKEKAKRDRIELEDNTTKAKREAMLLTKEYQQKRGATVAEDKTFYMDAMDQYGQMRERILADVSDPDVHKSLDQRLELGSVNFQEGLIDHVYNEQQRYGDEVYESTVEVEAEDMGANFESDSQVMQSADRIRQMTHDYAVAKGIPLNSDMYTKILRDNMTKGHVNVIEAWVESENPAEAAEYFAENKDEIDGDVHDNINKLLKTSGIKQRSIDTSDALFEQRPSGMSDAEFTRWGTDWIRDNVADDDRDETIRRFKARIGEDSAIDKQVQIDYGDQAYDIYNDAVKNNLSPMNAFNSIPDTIIDKMDPRTVTAMRNMAEKRAQNKTIHTDPETFLDLYEMATGTPEQKAQFRDRTQTNIRNYMHKLSTAHVAYFAKLQDDEDALAIASTWADLKKEVATTAGHYNPKTGKKKNADGIFEVNQRFDRELKTLQDSTGKKATPADGRVIADRLKIEYIRKGTFGPFSWTTRVGVMEGEIEGVPTESIDEIASDIRNFKRGLIADGEKTYTINGEQYKLTSEDPTETDIQLFYAFKSGQRQRGGQSSEAPPAEYYEGTSMLMEMRRREDELRIQRGEEPKWSNR